MKKVIDFLSGKKTYICTLLAVVLVLLLQAGLITEEIFNFLATIIGASTVAAFRIAIEKIEKK